MPELPEVETIRRGLSERMTGTKLLKVEILEPKSAKSDFLAIIGARVSGFRRFGKMMVIDFGNEWSIMVHLRMTGQMIWEFNKRNSLRRTPSRPASRQPVATGGARLSSRWRAPHDLEDVVANSSTLNFEDRFAGGHPNENFVDELPNKQTRIILEFDRGMLFFNDQRKFGFMKAVKSSEVVEDGFVRKLGKEPWGMSGEELFEIFRKHKNVVVKAALLNQENIAGLGNIYADETLFEARIHPERRCGEISKEEAERILMAARKVMDKAIEAGGSTLENYVKADGTRGDYLDLFAKVYNREGKNCPRCGAKIKKIRVAGRGTYFCPVCQEVSKKFVQEE